MAPTRSILTWLLALSTSLAGCSDDSGPTAADASLDLAAAPDSATADRGSAREKGAADQGSSAGTPTVLSTNIKSMVSYVDLASMKVLAETSSEVKAGTYDFYTTHVAASTPGLLLGAGVTAANLGNTQGYDDVTEAPASGYAKDDLTAGTYAVGTTWWKEKDPVNHSFVMSKNIYVLKLADGSYGKIEVLSAGQGTITLRCYHQPDKSTRLATKTP